ncbi:unnamed protein product [Phytophthora fragariaefolia]|uniref:Unnamed protein product n=1 Tax=Phytophthora fragariaefolia TaxID=1490495 RepID=A0A9W7CJ67_9STRA|nr:unnamed protein product [Phytophthora fragariaefolia]
MNNESKTEGLPYGWDGKYVRRNKWTMRTIFREHDLLDIAEGKIKRDGLRSEESEGYLIQEAVQDSEDDRDNDSVSQTPASRPVRDWGEHVGSVVRDVRKESKCNNS